MLPINFNILIKLRIKIFIFKQQNKNNQLNFDNIICQ